MSDALTMTAASVPDRERMVAELWAGDMEFPGTMMTMQENSRVDAELVRVAQAMLAGRLDLLEGVRKINALRFRTRDPEAAVFLPIRAIDSETDHFPVGELRLRYGPARLQEIDRERALYLSEARHDIWAACEEIVRLYS